MKRTISILLIGIILLLLSACGGEVKKEELKETEVDEEVIEATKEDLAEENEQEDEETNEEPIEEIGTYKIGIITGTGESPDDEEGFRAAQNMKNEYGDMIVLSTYSDRFWEEQETTIKNMMDMGLDPDIKAIVMVQTVHGADIAIERIRETRDDILFVLGIPLDDPLTIGKYGDIILNTNDQSIGTQTIQQAKEMGAETFVFYSHDRHMSYSHLADRRDFMKEEAEKNGLQWVEEMGVDSGAWEDSVIEAQHFIIEDVPRKVSEFGENTAFVTTDSNVMETLIDQVIEARALLPIQQYCPSAHHKIAKAFDVIIPSEKTGNLNFNMDEIKSKVIEAGMEGRVGSWSVPANMAFVEAGVKYAIEYLEGNTDSEVDQELLTSIMEEVADGPIELEEYLGYEHYFLYLGSPTIF